jgi:hypothetical protein
MDFNCLNCGKLVLEESFGTKNRNHCPFCLYSLHVDINPGDRKSECLGLMEPIGLTFKQEGFGKYGKKKQGEIMLIHKCLKCSHICINRIAGDDDSELILKIFDKGKDVEDIGDIHVLKTDEEKEEVRTQLYGKA